MADRARTNPGVRVRQCRQNPRDACSSVVAESVAGPLLIAVAVVVLLLVADVFAVVALLPRVAHLEEDATSQGVDDRPAVQEEPAELLAGLEVCSVFVQSIEVEQGR